MPFLERVMRCVLNDPSAAPAVVLDSVLQAANTTLQLLTLRGRDLSRASHVQQVIDAVVLCCHLLEYEQNGTERSKMLCTYAPAIDILLPRLVMSFIRSPYRLPVEYRVRAVEATTHLAAELHRLFVRVGIRFQDDVVWGGKAHVPKLAADLFAAFQRSDSATAAFKVTEPLAHHLAHIALYALKLFRQLNIARLVGDVSVPGTSLLTSDEAVDAADDSINNSDQVEAPQVSQIASEPTNGLLLANRQSTLPSLSVLELSRLSAQQLYRVLLALAVPLDLASLNRAKKGAPLLCVKMSFHNFIDVYDNLRSVRL